MPKKELLLEIGTEEIPSGYIQKALDQLSDKLIASLKESRLIIDNNVIIKKCATPRRMCAHLQGILDKQFAKTDFIFGPPINIAKDNAGKWTGAAIGFAKKNNIDIKHLIEKADEKGVKKAYAEISLPQENASGILQNLLPALICNLNFPKSMKWIPESGLKYARPLRWIVCLLNKDIIPIKIENIPTGSVTFGHRFLSKDKEINIKSADFAKYENILEKNGVIVDQEKRRQLIKSKILEKVSTVIDERLLDEVTFLTEFPSAILGDIPEEFVNAIPQEVLETCMKHHQRYFSVVDAGNERLLPYFVSITNGAGDEKIVKKNNERVLNARLSDAAFFFCEDTKKTLINRFDELKDVVFQKDIGSYYDKANSMLKLSDKISKQLKLDKKQKHNLDKAIKLCKVDLITNMVYEFPELQGIMGGIYSKINGEDEETCFAVYTQYALIPAKQVVPDLLKIIDRLDTLISSFNIGTQVTGSSDPYGLRRCAYTIVDLIHTNNFKIDLFKIFDDMKKEQRERLIAFFKDRIKYYLSEQNIKSDVVEAVLMANIDDFDINELLIKAKSIAEFMSKGDFSGFSILCARVINIISQAQEKKIDYSFFDEKLFEKDEEKILFKQYKEIKDKFKFYLDKSEYENAFKQILLMEKNIHNFFDNVMVMVDDEKVRSARLNLLNNIGQMFLQIADFRRVQGSGS